MTTTSRSEPSIVAGVILDSCDLIDSAVDPDTLTGGRVAALTADIRRGVRDLGREMDIVSDMLAEVLAEE